MYLGALEILRTKLLAQRSAAANRLERSQRQAQQGTKDRSEPRKCSSEWLIIAYLHV